MHNDDLLGAAVVSNAAWCDAVCRSHGFPGTFSSRLWTSPQHSIRIYPHAITLSPQVTAPELGNLPRSAGVKDSFSRLDLEPAGFEVLFQASWIMHDGAIAAAPDWDSDLTWDKITSTRELDAWQTAWAGEDDDSDDDSDDSGDDHGLLFRPELLADPRCAILACRTASATGGAAGSATGGAAGSATGGGIRGGAISYTANGVAGLSNVFSAGLPEARVWASVGPAVAALRPGLPIIGYEHGADLETARQAGFRALGPLRVWIRPERAAGRELLRSL